MHYNEKYYAAGKVPGGFFKREARPTEKETLTSRLIDRPIRPLFVPGFKNEVLVICTVLSHDLINDPDVLAMIAASAALTISGAPFMGPIACARVGFSEGEYVLNPTVDDMHGLRNNPDQRLDLVVAGTKDAVMMVESEAYELSEAEMLGAVTFAHAQMQPVIDLIIALAEDAAKEPFDYQPADYSDLSKAVAKAGDKAMRKAFAISDKQERTAAVGAAREVIKAALSEEQLEDENLGSALKKLEASILRGDVVKTGKRIDGRDTTTVRPISCETGLLPRTHGSALFTRGETQGLVVTTLGTGEDEQMIDALQGMYKSNFMLHYNFPPLLGRRSWPLWLYQSARDRPRQAGLARVAGGSARGDRFSLYGAAGFRDHRKQRVIFDGLGLRWFAQHDGRGRATEIGGSRCGDGADPRRQRRLRHPDRYSG